MSEFWYLFPYFSNHTFVAPCSSGPPSIVRSLHNQFRDQNIFLSKGEGGIFLSMDMSKLGTGQYPIWFPRLQDIFAQYIWIFVAPVDNCYTRFVFREKKYQFNFCLSGLGRDGAFSLCISLFIWSLKRRNKKHSFQILKVYAGLFSTWPNAWPHPCP